MQDGLLTISKLMQIEMPNAFFAFLSACGSAMGDRRQPHETVHLAASMLFAGFKSVLATMWCVYLTFCLLAIVESSIVDGILDGHMLLGRWWMRMDQRWLALFMKRYSRQKTTNRTLSYTSTPIQLHMGLMKQCASYERMESGLSDGLHLFIMEFSSRTADVEDALRSDCDQDLNIFEHALY